MERNKWESLTWVVFTPIIFLRPPLREPGTKPFHFGFANVPQTWRDFKKGYWRKGCSIRCKGLLQYGPSWGVVFGIPWDHFTHGMRNPRHEVVCKGSDHHFRHRGCHQLQNGTLLAVSIIREDSEGDIGIINSRHDRHGLPEAMRKRMKLGT